MNKLLQSGLPTYPDSANASIKVESCYFMNTTCFLSQMKWMNAIKRIQADPFIPDPVRNRWFLSNWSLQACMTTLLADCSEYILNINISRASNDGRRRSLLRQIRRIVKTCAQLRDAKVQELSDNEPRATLLSLYSKLSETQEGRTGYVINYISVYSIVPIICDILKTALGGEGSVAAVEAARTLAEWLDLFAKKQPQGEFGFNYRMEQLLTATLETADDWRRFAADSGTSVAAPRLFRRWLLLAGIRPNV